MPDVLNFKLDPSSLPKLDPKGENFLDWRAAWTRGFRFAGLADVISGEKLRPNVADQAGRAAWDRQDDQAFVMLLSAIHSDLTTYIANCVSSADAWKTLADRFDRDTGNSTIYLFRTLTNLRYEDGGDLQAHLDTFRQLWTKLYTRTTTSNQSVGKSMKTMFESDDVKGSFFLTTLPDSMDHIVDNLSSRNVSKFSEIEPKMLDIASRNKIEESEAYYTSTSRKKLAPKGANRSAPKGANSDKSTRTTSKDKGKECTWCRSRNYTFVGHLYTDCDKLAEHKQKQKKRGAANQAVDDDGEPSDDDALAFHASAEITAFAAGVPADTASISSWIFDSGASKHMSGCIEDFATLQPRTGTITVAGGARLPVEGVGTVELLLRLPDDSTHKCKLSNVLYSRHLKSTRLFSWTSVRNRFRMLAQNNDIFLIPKGDESQPHVLWAKYQHGNFEIQTVDNESALFSSYEQFHEAFGHGNVAPTVARRLYVDGESIPPKPKDFECEACRLSKSTRSKPASLPMQQSTTPFELIHSDLSGKFSTPSISGSRYFVSFIDDYTRHSWVYFINKKSQTPQIIDDFLTMVRTQHKAEVKAFASDNGGEYVNDQTKTIFRKRGIAHRKSPPYQHESNGIPERWNRTIITDARTALPDDDSLLLWPEAVAYMVYLRNRKPHQSLPCHVTPFERLYGRKPSIGHLQPFYRACYLHIPVEARKPGTKLLDRAEKAHFVGFDNPTSNSVYRLYVPLRKVITTATDAHVKWRKSTSTPVEWSIDVDSVDSGVNRPPSPPQPRRPADIELPRSPVVPPSPSPRKPSKIPVPSPKSSPVITRSGRQVKPSAKAQSMYVDENDLAPIGASVDSNDLAPIGANSDQDVDSPISTDRRDLESGCRERHDMERPEPPIQYSAPIGANYSQFDENATALLAVEDDDIPETFAQVLRHAERDEWLKAINAELNSHIERGTFEECPIRPGQHPVDPRWVFAKKYHASGLLARRKARLVARGFTQIHGVNYDDTYSPVARYDSLRLIFRIAAIRGWIAEQMDIDTAYLYSLLRHEVYMRPPPGYRTLSKHPIVLKVLRALYGLKQSGREWFGTLSTVLLEHCTQSHFDPCVFVGEDIIVAIYVDDILLVGSDPQIRYFKNVLATQFKCKDLGPCRYFLGLEVDQSPRGITISQRGYAERILKRFDMLGCNGRRTPVDPNSFPRRLEDGDVPVDAKTYQSLTGSLNFLVTGTRVDLAFPSGMLSTFNAAPMERHLNVAKQVLRYVKQTLDYKNHFPRSTLPARVDMFADASYNTDPDNSKSFAGYAMLINGSTVAWSSKRQPTVAKSTCEAEYMACSTAASHLRWTLQALKDLRVDVKPRPLLHVDNQPALDLVQNNRVNSRTKHIAVHYHFVQERVGVDYDVVHVPSEDNLADICTKALTLPTLDRLTEKLGLR